MALSSPHAEDHTELSTPLSGHRHHFPRAIFEWIRSGDLQLSFGPNLQAHPKISSLGIGDDPVLGCMPESSHLLSNTSVQADVPPANLLSAHVAVPRQCLALPRSRPLFPSPAPSAARG